MASFVSKTSRIKISIILNLIKSDCGVVYERFYSKKTKLKYAIELYEEYMSEEINSIFHVNNNFSDIVRYHQKSFSKFIDKLGEELLKSNSTQSDIVTENGNLDDESKYVLHISLQEWLLQGPKGQYFYFVIDIDSFNLTTQLKMLHAETNGNKKVFIQFFH